MYMLKTGLKNLCLTNLFILYQGTIKVQRNLVYSKNSANPKLFFILTPFSYFTGVRVYEKRAPLSNLPALPRPQPRTQTFLAALLLLAQPHQHQLPPLFGGGHFSLTEARKR